MGGTASTSLAEAPQEVFAPMADDGGPGQRLEEAVRLRTGTASARGESESPPPGTIDAGDAAS